MKDMALWAPLWVLQTFVAMLVLAFSGTWVSALLFNGAAVPDTEELIIISGVFLDVVLAALLIAGLRSALGASLKKPMVYGYLAGFTLYFSSVALQYFMLFVQNATPWEDIALVGSAVGLVVMIACGLRIKQARLRAEASEPAGALRVDGYSV